MRQGLILQAEARREDEPARDRAVDEGEARRDVEGGERRGKRLRRAFDPDNRSNPGKILPSTRFCMEANPKARGYDRVPFA